MRNIKLEIEYDGTNYCGWQIQGGRRPPASGLRPKSIQEVIENTLQKILQEKIKLIGSGRTDAGVHALGQVANFKTNSKIGLEKLQRALNGLLPQEISVSKAEEKPLKFHSRFDAKSKLYRYTILNRRLRSALLINRVYFYPYPLNVALMRKEARVLLGKHDFRAFCGSASAAKDTVRAIKRLSIQRISYPPFASSLISIDIEADGFLYNMVRNIVGTLLEIGRGRFAAGSLKQILLSRDRKNGGATAPAKGLCLLKVRY